MLDNLVNRLLPGETLALEEMSGIGKTALVVELAYNPTIRERFKDGVLWAGLGRLPDVMRTLTSWAEALGRDISRLSTEAERSQAVRDAIGQRQMLLVIDDAWHTEPANWLRCGGANCCHILTTRDKAIARTFAGRKRVVQVPVLKYNPQLEDNPAYELLADVAPEACSHDPAAARSLAAAVGGLPLALILLGSYLSAPERSYYPELSEAALAEAGNPIVRLELAQRRLGAISELEMTLRETVALSLEGLPREAVDAFYALGAFSPQPDYFDKDAALAVIQADLRALALLIARNLVKQEGDGLSLHQVVSDVARENTESDAVAHHRGYYLALVKKDPDDWHQVAEVYGQTKWAWKSVVDYEMLREYAEALWGFQYRRGLWGDLLEWANRGLSRSKTMGWQEDIWFFLNGIGLVYDYLGQRDKALQYHQRALSVAEEANISRDLTTTLNNIGLLYCNLGQRDKALEYFKKALAVGEEGSQQIVATILNNIGLLYYDSIQMDEALEYFQRSLAVGEELLHHQDIATTVNNIGLVHYSLGRRDKALEYFKKALLIREEAGDVIGLPATLTSIGGYYKDLGQLDKALEYYQRALSISKEANLSRDLTTTLNCVGNYYKDLEQMDKALEYYQRALSVAKERRQFHNIDSILENIALVTYRLGDLYKNQGQLDKALEYYQKALSIGEEAGNRLMIGTSLVYIGTAYLASMQLEKAIRVHAKI